MLKYSFAFLLFSVVYFSANAQQRDSFELPPWGMGIPEGEDDAFDTLPVKARLSRNNYRDVGSKASLKRYCPTPKSQGQYGTCTAWSSGYAGRTILEAQKRGWTNQRRIDEAAFSPGFLYRVSNSRADCNGAYVSKCVQNLVDYGIPHYKDFSVSCPQTAITNNIYKKAAQFKMKSFATLWNSRIKASNKQKVELVKKSLSEGNPVVIALYAPKSFYYTQDLWTPKETEQAHGNQGHQHSRHSVCVVAYDDDMYGGAFQVMNSWGVSWGNKGFTWIAYKDFAEFVYQAVELHHLDGMERNDEVVKLHGGLRLIEQNGHEMQAQLQQYNTYKMDRAYRSGTRFRLYISNEEPAYVYAIGSDLSHETYSLFPYQKGVSPYLNYRSSNVPIPSEDRHLRMDNKVGTDYICIIYSKKPLNMDVIKNKIKRESHRYSFKQKVERTLNLQMMQSSDIVYNKEQIQFKAEAVGKNIACIFLEIEHVD